MTPQARSFARTARYTLSALCILAVGQLRADVPPGGAAGVRFIDRSAASLPAGALDDTSMDARAADLDGDGDLDLVVAIEFGRNVLLINDGAGVFTDESGARLPQPINDSEDIAIDDFDGDGDLDLVFVSEDDVVNEYYWNDGDGFFTDVSNLLPVNGVSNAVECGDLTGDGFPDLVIGNRGQNVFLRNDGFGGFIDETGPRFPVDTRTTQDLELGDVDGDGDLDLVSANEEENRLWLNQGAGVFVDASGRIPLPPGGEETRETALGDIDGDGDLDLFFANVDFFTGFEPPNRLLINDGDGFFTDESALRLPFFETSSVDVDFEDAEGDGDLDLLLANTGGFQLMLNEGDGTFVDATSALVSTGPGATVFDIEPADYDGDGFLDFYLSDFFSDDRLLFGVERAIFWEFEPVIP